MPELYSETPEPHPEDFGTSTRGIRRPFAAFAAKKVQKAFDTVVGAKPEPSEGEIRLIRRAEKYCRILAKLPAVRRVWVCNSLSMNAADADSDIDLFVETEPGRIWTGRIVTTLFFSLLGVRRHGNKVKGRFCLSFFAAEGADFGRIAVEDDVYLYEWARRLVPVDGKNGTGGSLTNAPQETFPSRFSRLTETVLKALFLPKTLREHERLGKPWGVVISDEFLKFHPEDRRIEIREDVRKGLEGERE